MSVINQMLKDLQQRQGEQSEESSSLSLPVVNHQPKNVLLIIIITVILTLTAVYMLHLHDENQRLKNNAIITASNVNKADITVDTDPNKKSFIKPLPIDVLAIDESAIVQIANKEISRKTLSTTHEDLAFDNPSQLNNNNQASVVIEGLNTNTLASTSDQTLIDSTSSSTNNIHKEDQTKLEIIKPLSNKAVIDVNEQLNNTRRVAELDSHKNSTMTISRTQLSPEALAKQKMNRAKEAVANNNMAKAEQLFEDVLLVTPENKDARKQLAALWFGRQEYQSAINLLLQGIHLQPNDPDLRSLIASIYNKQGNFQASYQILQSLPDVQHLNNLEYQSLLATSAQKSTQFIQAIDAYQRLVNLQKTAGKWWLGLGIAYDSDGQFELASKAYKQALAQQNLSNNARQFIKQRMLELGE